MRPIIGLSGDLLNYGIELADAPNSLSAKVARKGAVGKGAKALGAKGMGDHKAKAAPRAKGRPAGKRGIGKAFLIDRTADLLRTVPPEKLSLSMAARHADVHLTLFKYYFTDRTRLLVDVARNLSIRLGDDVAEIEADGLTATERLRIRIDAMADFFFVNPYYHRLMVEIIGDDNDPLATELINIWMTKTLDIYREIIDAGVKEGSLRPINPYFTFIAMMALCEQFQHASRLAAAGGAGGQGTAKEAADQYKAFVYDLLMRGITSGS